MLNVVDLLQDLLAIESPTFFESDILDWISQWLASTFPAATVTRSTDGLICRFESSLTLPHVAFVGHVDVVPEHVAPTISEDCLFGAGASDMKGGLAGFMAFVANYLPELLERYQLSLIFYAREEGTSLSENGLNGLISGAPDFFRSIDFAVVAEPTNLDLQLGCAGSIHCEITVTGKTAHSARPWDGKNALYEALPVISYFSNLEPIRHHVAGCDFFDVMTITESKSEAGRTKIPGYWKADVNFRYAPVHSREVAELQLISAVQAAGVSDFEIVDHAPAAQIFETPFLDAFVTRLGQPVTGKQAWTDVAQLSAINVAAVNFGPGLTAQCHRPDEYIRVSDLHRYGDLLCRGLLG